MLSLERTKTLSSLLAAAICNLQSAICNLQRNPPALVPEIFHKNQFQCSKFFRSGKVCLPSSVFRNSGDRYAFFIA